MPGKQNGRRQDRTQKVVTRVDHPNFGWFRFPNVGDGERGDRKPDARRDPETQRLANVGWRGLMQNVSDRCRRDAVRNESADQVGEHFPFGRSRPIGAVGPHRVGPSFSEQKRIPDKSQHPVGGARANDCQPVHSGVIAIAIRQHKEIRPYSKSLPLN
jgi:hypothetical protein